MILCAMKPKDLKKLFTFDERRPAFDDCIFYVPYYYAHYQEFVPPTFVEFFGNQHPVCVEYCSGNGDWIIEKAASNPDKNWIAVERRFDRVRKIWSKLKNQQLKNILVVSGEAETFTHHYLQDHVLEAVYINFPDPWPKMKHAKNRLLQIPFLNELARVLAPRKTLTVVTDDFPYLEQTVSELCSHPRFLPFFSAPYYQLELPGYGSSWFENLWRARGREIHYTTFVTHAT